jgi:hypothetical protein
LEEWITELRRDHLWGNGDPLFPATAIGQDSGQRFAAVGLARAHWASADAVQKIFKMLFEGVGLHGFNPHSFRHALAALGERTCRNPEEFKAWSQNLGHGAWRDTAKELFEGEEEAVAKKEAKLEYTEGLENVNEDLGVLSEKEAEFRPITTKAYLYLSGTPFKALATGEFIEEQIFNWTYTDEQRAKEEFAAKNPGKWNPYGALPQMRLLTYQMPDELVTIASAGEFDEFDLNEFFVATDAGKKAQFKHKSDVQKWLDIIRGQYAPKSVESLKTGTRPPFPYSDARLLPYLQHSFWFLPNVAACHAMANLLGEKQTSSGTSTMPSSRLVCRRASDWRHCHRSGRLSAAASIPRPSRCRAGSSPLASPYRSGHPS